MVVHFLFLATFCLLSLETLATQHFCQGCETIFNSWLPHPCLAILSNILMCRANFLNVNMSSFKKPHGDHHWFHRMRAPSKWTNWICGVKELIMSKTSSIDIGGRAETVSINRSKPAHIDLSQPVELPLPKRRSRLPRQHWLCNSELH